MEHLVDRFQDILQFQSVEVIGDELEILGFHQGLKVNLFHPPGIKIRERVDTEDRIPSFEKFLAKMGADKTGSSGD